MVPPSRANHRRKWVNNDDNPIYQARLSSESCSHWPCAEQQWGDHHEDRICGIQRVLEDVDPWHAQVEGREAWLVENHGEGWTKEHMYDHALDSVVR